jgi:peptidoglycan/xylan/chitin deacetylase (PgdA/CDA1 family)
MYRILTYHTIGDYGEILPAGINTPIQAFSAHMEYLYQHRYRVIPLDQMVDHIINGRPLNHKTLAITFDDGYEDHFLNAYPILKEYGFPATIFLTVKYINGYWESERAEGGKIKAISRDHLVEMHREGLVGFGSHGYSHRNLLDLNEHEKGFEIRDSKLYLEDLLGEAVPFISYPFGACDGDVKKIVRESGYRAGFCIWRRKPDIYSIRRIPLHTHDDVRRLRLKISPLYDLLKSILRLKNRGL